MDLSVVIIARNEEKTIGKSVESVLEALEEAKKRHVIDTSEVIFVDSASTDQTAEIVKDYPIEIIQLEKDWPLSASAGIYTGYKAAGGTFLGVVDGDVEVDRYWFRDALQYLHDDKQVGNVYGFWNENSSHDSFLFQQMINTLNTLKVAEVKEVEFAGNGIFRRSALDDIGGHNPFLKGAEDKDISFRLREAGYKILQLPVKNGVHHWDFNFIEYYKSVRVWSLGEGHAAAYARATGNHAVFSRFVEQYPKSSLYRNIRHLGLTLALFISLAMTIISGGFWYWITLLLFALFLTLMVILWRRNRLPLPQVLPLFINRIFYFLFRFLFFNKGLCMPTLPPDTYPTVQKKHLV